MYTIRTTASGRKILRVKDSGGDTTTQIDVDHVSSSIRSTLSNGTEILTITLTNGMKHEIIDIREVISALEDACFGEFMGGGEWF